MKPLKRITLGVGALVLLAATWAAVYGVVRVRNAHVLSQCRFDVRDLVHSVEFVDRLPANVDGPEYFRDLAALRDNDGNTVASLGSCRCCGRPYVYSPVNPAGERLVAGDYDYFVLWCPEPCHMGQRVFLRTDHSNQAYRDDQVSWYYQKTADSLTADELAQEQKYRAEQGMPPLPQ